MPVRSPPGLRTLTLERGDQALLVVSYSLHEQALPEALSPAERDVVAAILRGRSNLEIARQRRSSVRTVANLVGRAFRKLGVRSRAELAARLGI
jgi:DNA-binding CsgD family transcriptional regulator